LDLKLSVSIKAKKKQPSASDGRSLEFLPDGQVLSVISIQAHVPPIGGMDLRVVAYALAAYFCRTWLICCWSACWAGYQPLEAIFW